MGFIIFHYRPKEREVIIMAISNFFMHRIKRSTAGTFDKGIEVKETYEAAKQSYHAYLGAYAYGQNASTDYVQCEITDASGSSMMKETWMAPEPEPEPEEEEETETEA